MISNKFDSNTDDDDGAKISNKFDLNIDDDDCTMISNKFDSNTDDSNDADGADDSKNNTGTAVVLCVL